MSDNCLKIVQIDQNMSVMTNCVNFFFKSSDLLVLLCELAEL